MVINHWNKSWDDPPSKVQTAPQGLHGKDGMRTTAPGVDSRLRYPALLLGQRWKTLMGKFRVWLEGGSFPVSGNSAGDLFGMVKTWPFQWRIVTSNDRGSKGHFESPGGLFLDGYSGFAWSESFFQFDFCFILEKNIGLRRKKNILTPIKLCFNLLIKKPWKKCVQRHLERKTVKKEE